MPSTIPPLRHCARAWCRKVLSQQLGSLRETQSADKILTSTHLFEVAENLSWHVRDFFFSSLSNNSKTNHWKINSRLLFWSFKNLCLQELVIVSLALIPRTIILICIRSKNASYANLDRFPVHLLDIADTTCTIRQWETHVWAGKLLEIKRHE